MPQITGAINIKNGADTPVDIAYSPESVSPDKVVLVDRSPGYPLGYRRITFTFSPSNSKRNTTRVGVSVSYPEISVVNDVPTLLHTARFQNGDFIIPDTMSTTGRASLRALVANGLDTALALAMVRDLDTVW